MVGRLFIRILVLCTLISACSPKSRPVKKSNIEQMHFNDIDLSPGTKRHLIKTNQGEAYEFYLTCPDHTSQAKFPLVMALHWAGGGEDFDRFHRCLAMPGFSEVPAFIISPDANNDVWYSDKNSKMILDLVNLAKQHWPVDENKIIVMGYSSGGMGAWYFTSKHANIFSAGIPMAATFKPQTKIDVPIYVIHGEKDELFDVQMTQVEIETATAYGSEVFLSVEPSYSHYMACEYVGALKEGVAWIMNKLEH
jgi:predicted peptidase